MRTKKIFTTAYRQDYFEGYSNGLDPFNPLHYTKTTNAFLEGIKAGRVDYESMNGPITNGIPALIVTNKVLDEFLLAGLLGLSVDTEGYTAFQLHIIAKWYQSGTEKYDPDQSMYLAEILEQKGISIN